MGKPPMATLNGSQSARDQWSPVPLLRCAALALHSAVYLNTYRHPRGGEIAPDPLKPISSQAGEKGNCLMKMDHSDGFTFHFLTAGIRLYYSQSSPLSLSDSALREALCTHFGCGFSGFSGLCVCVSVFVCMHAFVWLLPPECKNLPSWRVNGGMLTIQPGSIWPHSAWSSCSARSPVK